LKSNFFPGEGTRWNNGGSGGRDSKRQGDEGVKPESPQIREAPGTTSKIARRGREERVERF